MDRPQSRLQAYRRLSDALSRAHTSVEVCHAALEYVHDQLALERCAVRTFDEQGVLRFRAWRGISDTFRASVERFADWTPDVREPKPVIVLDVATEPLLGDRRIPVLAEGIARMALLPLFARGRLIGKLLLYGGPEDPFAREWLGEALVAADVIANAIDAHESRSQLRKANGLLTAVMESLPDAMGLVDASGQLVYTTRRIEAFFPLPVHAMLGLDAPGFFAAVQPQLQDGAAVLERLQAGMATRRPFTIEMRHVDGRQFEFTAVPTSAPGALEGHLIQLRDVTDRQEFQSRMLHASKMESIGRLAGGVAHDFNNMLTAMIGYMDLVAIGLPQGSEEQGYLTQALEAAEQASGLTRQLLAFARRQPVEPSPQDVNALVERVAPLLRRLVPDDIQIETKVTASPGWVLADAGQLEQVLVNLAFNARDAMPDGGLLVLGTSRLASQPAGDVVVIDVADTGIGMSAETRERLFEPFYTTKPDGQGAGLGLATVYGIVQAFGGKVEVASTPGRGARFRVLLPAIDPPAARKSGGGMPHGDETVMLVEDDVSVRGLVVAMLGRLGYQVLAAERADDALEQLAAHDGVVHLLVADIIMPGMSGRELATRALAARPGMRVLLTSGHGTAASGQPLAAGYAFMPKPFSIETLAVRVREALASAPVAQTGLPQ
jgi:PAS domain S-box-containing protein